MDDKKTYVLIKNNKCEIVYLTEAELEILEIEFKFDQIVQRRNYTEARRFILDFFNFEKAEIRVEANRFKYGKKENVLRLSNFRKKNKLN